MASHDALTTEAPPHCGTCRCIVPDEPWRRYALETKNPRRCGCGAETEHPGKAGWVWRYRWAEGGRVRHRATESLCPGCNAVSTGDNSEV